MRWERAGLWSIVLALAPLAACDRVATERASAEQRPADPHAVAGVVDSVVPREIALARFQASATRVTALAGGTRSRDALVERYVRGLERRDTAGVRALALTRDEFAFLYYPTNPQGLPPYDLSPSLQWFLIEGNTEKGLSRAMEERGGRPLRYAGYACQGEASREGDNTVWGPCEIRRLQAAGDTVTERLFGQIIERGGTYKFVSLANKF